MKIIMHPNSAAGNEDLVMPNDGVVPVAQKKGKKATAAEIPIDEISGGRSDDAAVRMNDMDLGHTDVPQDMDVDENHG